TIAATVNTSGAPRDVAIGIANPSPSDCAETFTGVFGITPPPTITAIAPDNVCEGVATTLTILGTGFVATTEVFAGTMRADSVMLVSATELRATWTLGLPAGTYDIRVDNGAGCSDTLAGALVVDPTPIVFFVDPRTVYNGIATEVTIFASGLDATARSVELVDAGGMRTSLTFRSPLRPNRIQATVPLGMTPGDYDVVITSDIGCVSTIPGRVTITDTLTLALDSIEPAFVSPTEPTAVTVYAQDPAPMGEVQFAATPRAYLSPSMAGAGTVATAMRSVVFVDPTTLTAVVPAGLPPGRYDLIVVNPAGEVGLLPMSVTVTVGEPPVITSVSPASLDNNAAQVATVEGRNFSTTGVTLEMDCRDPGTGLVTTYPVVANMASLTSTSVSGTFPANMVAGGAVCVVRLTNTDGAIFEFSAISIRNPAQNLNPW
ncbi:MAG: hypothetical protein FD127_4200, partial [Acidimicrobiaceae bacterium]